MDIGENGTKRSTENSEPNELIYSNSLIIYTGDIYKEGGLPSFSYEENYYNDNENGFVFDKFVYYYDPSNEMEFANSNDLFNDNDKYSSKITKEQALEKLIYLLEDKINIVEQRTQTAIVQIDGNEEKYLFEDILTIDGEEITQENLYLAKETLYNYKARLESLREERKEKGESSEKEDEFRFNENIKIPTLANTAGDKLTRRFPETEELKLFAPKYGGYEYDPDHNLLPKYTSHDWNLSLDFQYTDDREINLDSLGFKDSSKYQDFTGGIINVLEYSLQDGKVIETQQKSQLKPSGGHDFKSQEKLSELSKAEYLSKVYKSLSDHIYFVETLESQGGKKFAFLQNDFNSPVNFYSKSININENEVQGEEGLQKARDILSAIEYAMPGLDLELSNGLSNYEPYLPRFDGYLEEKPEAVEIREFIQDLKFNENIEKNNSRGFDYNLDIDITNPYYQLSERYADAGITGEVIKGFSLVEGSEENSDNRAFGLNNMPKQIKIG